MVAFKPSTAVPMSSQQFQDYFLTDNTVDNFGFIAIAKQGQ
jgi:hypothetical protein